MNTTLGRPVVVGVDGSDSALRAVRWGAAEAARRGLSLRLVSAFGWTDEFTVSYPGLGGQYRETLLEQAQQGLAAAAAEVTAAEPGLRVEKVLLTGYPIPTLVEQSREAELLAVGDHGAGRVEGLLLGSVGTALVSHAACPTVVVRGESEPSATRPVVVGVDASPVSEAAIAFAFREAADRSVPLVAVHTWWDGLLDAGTAAQLYGDEQTYEERQLAERLAGWSEKYPQVEVIRAVTRDRPAQRLLDRSGSAQLVVVGTRGHGEFAGLVLSSVSNALVHKSACPVAVVRPSTPEQA